MFILYVFIILTTPSRLHKKDVLRNDKILGVSLNYKEDKKIGGHLTGTKLRFNKTWRRKGTG